MRHVIVFFAIGLAGVFVCVTGVNLPEMVASHFDAAGAANGFTPRATYLGTMLLLVTLLPIALGLAGRVVAVLPTRFVNLPNAEFWLAPERKAATLRSLSAFLVVPSLLTCALICFVHALTVRANALQPAHLSTPAITAALGASLVATLIWLFMLWRRFTRLD
ncbi:MAG: hypothetical protein ABIR62_10115 [Dokdonella sp.]|uniref:hypothetical protein n=1 Tax=Dokdonella sp. TaxID=2291710 RepID=UPI0032639595